MPEKNTTSNKEIKRLFVHSYQLEKIDGFKFIRLEILLHITGNQFFFQIVTGSMYIEKWLTLSLIFQWLFKKDSTPFLFFPLLNSPLKQTEKVLLAVSSMETPKRGPGK